MIEWAKNLAEDLAIHLGEEDCRETVELFAEAIMEAGKRERERLLGRLRNPDEALVEAVARKLASATQDYEWQSFTRMARRAVTIIATALEAEQTPHDQGEAR